MWFGPPRRLPNSATGRIEMQRIPLIRKATSVRRPAPLEKPDVVRLHAQKLPLIPVDVGAFSRVSHQDFPSVIHYGEGALYRFDDPQQEFGVLYAGNNYLTCVVESILRDELRVNARPVYRSDLEKRVIATLAPATATLNLVDLTEAIGIGLDNQIATTPDYAISQAWSRALYTHPKKPDGLLYASRNYPKGLAIAVFKRAGERIKIEESPGSRTSLVKAADYPAFLQLLRKNGIPLRR